MKVTMVLADAAQVAQDKLYLLGGGWTWCGPQPATFAVGLLLEIPWDQTGRPHHWLLRLVDEDGHVVLLPGPKGEQPLVLEGRVETGRPPGAPEGAPITVPLAFNFAGVPLPPGGRYVVELTVDDQTTSDWRLQFNTRAAS